MLHTLTAVKNKKNYKYMWSQKNEIFMKQRLENV